MVGLKLFSQTEPLVFLWFLLAELHGIYLARQSFRLLAIIIASAGHAVPVATNYKLFGTRKIGIAPTSPAVIVLVLSSNTWCRWNATNCTNTSIFGTGPRIRTLIVLFWRQLCCRYTRPIFYLNLIS